MATTQDRSTEPIEDTLDRFLRTYCREDIQRLVTHYPNERRSLDVDWGELHQAAPDVADDYLDEPVTMHRYLDEALYRFDVSVDVSLEKARVRVYNLPEAYSYHPGEFSPSDHQGAYRGIRGEITKTSNVYPKFDGEAAFECQLCSTITRVPQADNSFQEPHECQGCERQGPFKIDFEKSEFVDAQKLRIKVPPELSDGAGQKIDAFVEDDITGQVTIGDRVRVSGIIQFEQEGKARSKKPTFDPYLEGHHVEIEETDQEDLDITSDERARIQELASGADGDPLEVAAQSLSEKVYGYETEKKALILAMASGDPIEYGTGDQDRPNLHVLLIGDPSTGKSRLVNRAADIGWRTVSVSSQRTSAAGLTVAADHDDFGDGGWSLKAGALVRANGGTVCIDELDDMESNTRSALLEPMANQKIHAELAGERATFRTETSVIAAANPSEGRFDKYAPVFDQIDFRSALVSRFDLIFTTFDRPDEETDWTIAGHILDARDEAKRREDGDDVDLPVEPDLLRKWIALAKQQPNPPFAGDAVKKHLREGWANIRGLYDYDDDQPVPVTTRDLEGIIRIAEAAAKFELADAVEMRHAQTATELMGESMRAIGQNDDGEFDADAKETGSTKSQRDRKKTLVNTLIDLQNEADSGKVGKEKLADTLADDLSIDQQTVRNDIDKLLQDGLAIEPDRGYIRYVGGA